MRIGIPAETRPGETRVAATPETVKKLAAKHAIVVHSGAGERALTREGVVAKFMASSSLAIAEAQAKRICNIVLDIENRSTQELAHALRLD